MIVALLLACTGGKDRAAPTDPTPDDSAPEDTADAGWVSLPSNCEAPSPLPDDPLTRTGLASFPQVDGGPFLEAIDLAREGDLIFAVGQGGLVIVDFSDPAAPAARYGPWDPAKGKLHRVISLGDGLIVTSQRDQGLSLWDVSDPSAAAIVGSVPAGGLEGLAFADGRLYVTERDRGLRVYDLRDPSSPALVAEATGLSAPWNLASSGDGWLYAADNSLGVVPIDVRLPDAPVVGEPVDAGRGALHVAYADDRLYAALGADGVAIYDVSDRASPRLLSTVETGGSAVMSDVDDGRLWVADHEGLSVFDLSADPPSPIQREITDQFALAALAWGDAAVVGDWNDVELWTLDPAVQAGALDLPSTSLRVEAGAASATLRNRGGATLRLSGALLADEGATVSVSADAIAPGDAAQLQVSGLSADSTLCLASDDPDDPVLELSLVTAPPPPAGVDAPDFALTGLDGQVYRLSEQLGHPVLLVYFATW